MKKNENGFGAVGILAVVVIVLLIGAVGWLVYDSQKDKTSSNTKVNDTAQTTAKSETTTENKTNTPQVSYFQIKELGVKFEQPTSLKGLYYHIGNNGRTAYFSLEELKGTDCAADKTATIALTRYTDADYNEDVQAAASKDSAKKIGNYYYSTASGQAMCSEDEAILGKASKMQQEIVKIVPSTIIVL